jgi:DNA-binding NarL/FixJ family response regulator
MINIILAEDHALVTEGLRAFFADEPSVVCLATCNTGEKLMHALTRHQPDIILMDINLPDANGIDLCKQVKGLYPQIHIIGLSINDHPSVIRKMMEGGASGYLLKDASRHEILEAITIVNKGKTYFSWSASMALKQTENAALPALTMREKQVLELIADGHTNQQIADILFVDVTTIDFHRKNMLSKYKVKNSAALVKLAITHKLI